MQEQSAEQKLSIEEIRAIARKPLPAITNIVKSNYAIGTSKLKMMDAEDFADSWNTRPKNY